MNTSTQTSKPGMIEKLLRTVNETLVADGNILSVYLDTSPSRTFGQAPLLTFHDACAPIRERLGERSRDERKRFEEAVAQVDRYLTAKTSMGMPGIAIFAAGTEDFFFTGQLPFRPPDGVAWADRPVVTPLVEALDDYERFAVLLFDKERARLFTIFLGTIEEQQSFFDEVPGKQATGDWFALSQKRYERHHEDHVLRHAKRAIRTLMDELRSQSFDRLFVGGPDEAISLLLHHLPRPLRQRLSGTLSLELFASNGDVLKAALIAAEGAERRDERDAVQELIESATTARATLGLEPTLAALSKGGVHRLLVADTLDQDGAICNACGRLTAKSGLCPVCGEPTEPTVDLREQAVERAIDQGARIEIVSGVAAERLIEHGGLGAWTRWEMNGQQAEEVDHGT